MSHTPGPWKFGGRASREVFESDTGRVVCKIHFAKIEALTNINFNQESLANAGVIAAAPALLAACEAAFERLTDNDMMALGSYPLTVQLKAAIAAAKGE